MSYRNVGFRSYLPGGCRRAVDCNIRFVRCIAGPTLRYIPDTTWLALESAGRPDFRTGLGLVGNADTGHQSCPFMDTLPVLEKQTESLRKCRSPCGQQLRLRHVDIVLPDVNRRLLGSLAGYDDEYLAVTGTSMINEKPIM